MAAKKKSDKKPIRREIGALVCFLLAIFSSLGLYFRMNAIFLNFLARYIAIPLLGWGAYLLPPTLMAAAVVLLFHRGKPVVLRLICILLFPVTAGALLHIFNGASALGWGDAISNGGLICGLLSKALRLVISSVGAAILLIILIVAQVFVLFSLSLVKLYDTFKNRPRYAPETSRGKQKNQPEPKAPKPPKPFKEPKSRRVDIPLYRDNTLTPEPSVNSDMFRSKPDDVLTPAQALAAKPKPITIPQVFHFDDEPSQLDPITGEDIKKPVSAPAPSVGTAGSPESDEIPPWEEAVSHAPHKSAPMPYKYPPLDLLKGVKSGQAIDVTEELRLGATRLIDVLGSFSITAHISDVTRGPTITRFEMELESGTKLARVTALSDDIALALGTPGVHISPVPGKINVVGVEVPNKLVSTVYIKDVLDTPEFKNKPSTTAFTVGRDISGNNIVADITKLTHLLVAGTTGSGKSIFLNSLIVSLLYKATPDEVKFIMVDPKMVELDVYNGIPHLLQPVVTDPKKAAGALEWAVYQMEKRFNLIKECGKRDIDSYNEFIKDDPDVKPMERIIIIIDEMADLMMVAKKEVETSIARIAQKARACGIHLILATQRPSAQVVTGIIKSNAPSRIAFAVASNIDSRIILDSSGAEKLIGRGDMLYFPIGEAKPKRVQGCFISDSEVEQVVKFVKQSGQAAYDEELIAHTEKGSESKQDNGQATSGGSDDDSFDNMLPAAIDVIIDAGQGSVSFLQRRLKLGYARAARLMDLMEERGIVGPFEGSKPRKVLFTRAQWDEMNGE